MRQIHMSSLTTEDRIIHLLEDFVLQGYEITRESTWEDMGLDSLEKIELLMDIEDEFNLVLPDEVMTMLDNVGEITDYVKRKQ